MTVAMLACASGLPSSVVARETSPRKRIEINTDWRFHKCDPQGIAGELDYGVRPQVIRSEDGKVADARPEEAAKTAPRTRPVLKPWILPPAKLELAPDRSTIHGDGSNLSFITVRIVDADGHPAPTAHDRIRFRVEGPGTLVATDNGDPTDMTPFPSHERSTFSGLALAIVRAQPGRSGTIIVRAEADGLQAARAQIVLDEAQDIR